VKYIVFLIEDTIFRNLVRYQMKFLKHEVRYSITSNKEIALRRITQEVPDLIVISTLDDGGAIFLREKVREAKIQAPAIIRTTLPPETIYEAMRGQNCIKILSADLRFDEFMDHLKESLYLVQDEVMDRLDKLTDMSMRVQKQIDPILDLPDKV